MKTFRLLEKFRTDKTKTIIIPTINFKNPFEESPLVQMYKNFKMEEHVPLENNKATIDGIKKEKPERAFKAGIRDEKMGIPMKDGFDAYCKKTFAPLEAMKEQAEKAKDNVSEMHNQLLEKAEQIDYKISSEKTKTENKALLDKVQTPLKNQIRDCKTNIEEQEGVIKDTNIILMSDEKDYPKKRPPINTALAKWLFMIFLMLPDFSITYYTLQSIVSEGANFQLFAMTLGLGGAYAWLSHLLGKYLNRNDRKKVFIFGLLSSFLLLFMTILRIVTGASLVFTILYIILFALGVAFSYLRDEKQSHYDAKGTNKEAKSRRNLEEGKKDILEGQIESNKKAFDIACKQNEKSAEMHRKLIKDNGRAIEKKFDKIIDGYVGEISILKADLEAEYTRGYRIAKQSTPSKSKINGTAKNGTTIMTLLIIAFLSLSSCTSPVMEAVGVIIDVTNEDVLENSKGEIKALLELHKGFGNGAGRQFYVTEISDRSFGRIHYAKPLGISEYWTRNELKRRAEIIAYEGSCDSILQLSFASMDGSGRKTTYILRNIKRMAEKINEGGADKKRLIIYSDLLSNNGNVNLYAYRGKIDSLEQDRDNIANALNKDSPVNLTGYDIIVVHQPSLLNDELVNAAWNFWEWYFKKHCNVQSIRFTQSLI